MRSTLALGVGVALFGGALFGGASLLAQGIVLPPGASPQATQDPGYQALIATCKTPPPAPAARAGAPPAGAARQGGERGAARQGGEQGAARQGGGQGGAQGAAPAAAPGRGPAAPAGPAEYTVTAIPGVIA